MPSRDKPMPDTRGFPREETALVTIQVVDWAGPIVEVLFHRGIARAADIEELMRTARSFLEDHVVAAGEPKAYFLTCYDHFSVSHDLAHPLQEAFLEFNRLYSKGDARYGGTVVAQTLIISTAIRAEKPSEICATRDEALQHLRARIRAEM
jgi:hypothetical protein